MGNTCKPMAASFQCMTKSTTIKKKNYLVKVKKKKKKERNISLKYLFLFIWLYQMQTLSCGMWDLVPRQGIEPSSLH